jgi:hypothetical protein
LNLRSHGVNLSPVLFVAPNLVKQPEMTEGNQLHIVGDFPTQPLKIQYGILFLQIDGIWRIDGLAVLRCSPASAPQSVSAPLLSGIPPVGQAQPAKPTASNGSEKKHQKNDKSIAGKFAPNADRLPAQPTGS